MVWDFPASCIVMAVIRQTTQGRRHQEFQSIVHRFLNCARIDFHAPTTLLERYEFEVPATKDVHAPFNMVSGPF